MHQKTIITEGERKIERCGFCGSYFKGLEYLTADELKAIPQAELDKVELGYCPNAQAEENFTYPEKQYVTRDMAIDAGDLSLEGQQI